MKGVWIRRVNSKGGQGVQVVIVCLGGPEMTEFEECVIASQWMASRVVLVLVDVADHEDDWRPAIHERAGWFMDSTWPVFGHVLTLKQVRA